MCEKKKNSNRVSKRKEKIIKLKKTKQNYRSKRNLIRDDGRRTVSRREAKRARAGTKKANGTKKNSEALLWLADVPSRGFS